MKRNVGEPYTGNEYPMVDHTTAVVMRQWAVMGSSIESMDGLLRILKSNLKLFTEFRKVRHREKMRYMTYNEMENITYIHHICHT